MIRESIFGKIQSLNDVYRYSSVPVLNRENIPTHTFWVSYYAYMIALELEQKGAPINKETLLIKALMHDVPEFLTGDIMRVFKYNNKQLLNEIERTESEMALDYFSATLDEDTSDKILKIFTTCKDKSIEGQIVALCDYLSVISYASTEYKKGNSYMKEILLNCIESMQEQMKNTPIVLSNYYLEAIAEVERLIKI